MSDYTPTTEEVRKILATCNPDVVYNHDLVSEFDRWLAEVKAQAWEEGCRWGAVEFQSLERKLYDEDKVEVTDADNPYRQGKGSGNSNSQPTAETPNYQNLQGEEQ